MRIQIEIVGFRFQWLFLHVDCLKKYVLFLSLVGASFFGFAQEERDQPRRGSRIIDDTTKQVYGPTTTRYYYEEDVFYNNPISYTIDTVIWDFHKKTYVQRNQHLYQDLGNIGTAARPLYFEAPDLIGVRSGIETFDLYWEAKKFRYYDTKSPYAHMDVFLGGRGRSMTDISFSRNINPKWNVGFDYRALLVDKQIQRRGKGDRHVAGTYYDLYTAYQSKNDKYRLFFHVARNKHRVFEYGGIRVDTADFTYEEFFSDNALPWLGSAESREIKIKLHLFHQYQIGKALQLYHGFDRFRQGRSFYDVLSSSDSYFDHLEVDSAIVRDEVKLVTLTNEVGVKGSLRKLFYNGYYRLRNYNMTYNYIGGDSLPVQTKGAESYLGGRMALQLDSLLQLRGQLEVMGKGNISIQGSLKSKWLEATLQQQVYTPGFVQQMYRGSRDYWSQALSNIEATQISGKVHYQSKWLKLSPGLTFTRLHDYVFFNEFSADSIQRVRPVQSSGDQIFTSPEVNFSIRFLRHVYFRTKGIYTVMLENADEAIRIPELFVNSQLSYRNIFFKGNLDMHAGVGVHWQSTYSPMGYDMAIQQFYNQDRFKAEAFPLVELFFNARIKRARIFVKYHNVVQFITKQGYFPTAFYPGQSNTIDFGFDWSFYD